MTLGPGDEFIIFMELYPAYTLEAVFELTPIQFFFMLEQGAKRKASRLREDLGSQRLVIASLLDKKAASELRKLMTQLDEIVEGTTKVSPQELKTLEGIRLGQQP